MQPHSDAGAGNLTEDPPVSSGAHSKQADPAELVPAQVSDCSAGLGTLETGFSMQEIEQMTGSLDPAVLMLLGLC